MDSKSRERHLLIIQDDKGRREFFLDHPLYSIGRDPDSDVRLISPFVSRRHATLFQLPEDDGTCRYRIIDGNLKGEFSVNGLLINGRKLREHTLENEDMVTFGPGVNAIYHLLSQEPALTEDDGPPPTAPLPYPRHRPSR